jgi:hypothetical protein
MYQTRSDLHNRERKIRLTEKQERLLLAVADLNGLQPAVQLRIWCEEAIALVASSGVLQQEFDRTKAG